MNSPMTARDSNERERDLSARRRRRASMACLNCRKSRIRCKVEADHNACTQCRQTGVSCAFDSRDGRKNRANSKVVANELSKRIRHLESLLRQNGHALALTAAEAEASNIPGHSVSQDQAFDFTEPQAVETDSESQGTPIYDDEPPPYTHLSQNSDRHISSSASSAPQHRSGSSESSTQSRNILGKLIPQPVKFDMASGRVRFFGPTTSMHILSRSTSDAEKSRESFWPISMLVKDLGPETHDYLIDLFFDCHNSALHIVHKWAFFDDLKGGGTQFYSNFLHMCMLAEGYRYADRTRNDIKKLAGQGKKEGNLSVFHAKAKKMAELELVKPGGIPSLQAFFLLGDLEVGIGRDDTGWMFAGMAFRLLFDVGLHVDPSELRLTEREVQIRHMVLWACIMNDVYWALYLGRPTMIKPSDIAPACLNKDFDRLIESQTRTYAYEKTIETRIYEALLQLMDLLEPLCETRDLRSKGPAVEREDAYLKIATLDRRLNGWYNELPERLKWCGENVRTAPSSFYLLHTQYHTALILLHRTFPTQPSSSKHTSASTTHFGNLSRQICVANALRVAEIITAYKARYSLQRIFVTGLQHIGTAATALMAEISMLQTETGRHEAQMERTRLLEYLRGLGECMMDMSETYQPAVLMASVVAHFTKGDVEEYGKDVVELQRGPHKRSMVAVPSSRVVTRASTLGTPDPPSQNIHNTASSSSSYNTSITSHLPTRATNTPSLSFALASSHPPPPPSTLDANNGSIGVGIGGLPFLPSSWFEDMDWEEDNEFLNLMGLKDLQGLNVGVGGGLMEGFELVGGAAGG
ncbi:hypothetical protein P280DRAFT_437412 [Massarina eburnea CBS 473.64]|uniref:Zn(2)-C6 fungal-type domain-containing protein n=1 Tax=Massarina eburnea CBS 473.64 TaxID=1395130 RepID=A0A6A6RIY7_9PLEO|nr:hypothetical protein P280DRAFT_437412 [Massarina eburnea CBS 473.64]